MVDSQVFTLFIAAIERRWSEANKHSVGGLQVSFGEADFEKYLSSLQTFKRLLRLPAFCRSRTNYAFALSKRKTCN
jgi:hypothetical protein